MEIGELIQVLTKESKEQLFFTRGEIIDYISNNTDNWILILKALLIKNPKKVISRYYILDKLRFMQKNPEQAHVFLDFAGLTIYNTLRGYHE